MEFMIGFNGLENFIFLIGRRDQHSLVDASFSHFLEELLLNHARVVELVDTHA